MNAGAAIHKLLAASLKTRWKRHRARLKSCQRKFSEEAVHELRVEIRRLLSTVELLGVFVHAARLKEARKILKKHLDVFDELRDTQVQLLHLNGLGKRLAGARAFVIHLRRQEKRGVQETRRRVRRFRTKRLAKLLDRSRQDLRARRKAGRGEKDWAIVLRAVSRAFLEVCWLRNRVRANDTKTIHRTRIAFKKFRYMVEALAPLLPEVDTSTVAAMHEYQAMMGDIQDAEVLLASFDRFLEKAEMPLRESKPFRRELLQRRQRAIRKYLSAADGLDRFWKVPDGGGG